MRVYLQVVPIIRLGGTLTKSQYQFTLFGPDLPELYAAAPRVEAKMRSIPGLMDVTSDLQITNPQVLVTVERDKASALHVSAAQIETALANAYSSRQISTIYTPTNQYQVIVELLPEFQRDSVDLNTLYIRSITLGPPPSYYYELQAVEVVPPVIEQLDPTNGSVIVASQPERTCPICS